MQTQIFVCNVEYYDFVVCTFPENNEANIHIERIFPDHTFWSNCVTKSAEFFKVCILTELLGRWYTRSTVIHSTGTENNPLNSNPSSSNDQTAHLLSPGTAAKKYCYCQQPEQNEMIACDHLNCKIEWFHTKCLKIKTIPKGKWYCPSCRTLPECKRGKKKDKK